MAASRKRISRRKTSPALEAGMSNLVRHVENVRKFGIVPIISINRFSSDTDAENALVISACEKLGVECYLADHWAMGGEGAADVARAVVRACESGKSKLKLPLSGRHAALRKDPHNRAGNLSREGHLGRQKRSDQLAHFESMGYGTAADLRRENAVQLFHQSGRQGRA